MGGDAPQQPAGPDLAAGIPESALPADGVLTGQVAGEPVLLARAGDEVLAIGAMCTHYGGPLGEGLRVGDTVRCPWHHACFSLRTGEATCAPALNPVPRYSVERRDGTIRVTGTLEPAPPRVPAAAAAGQPEAIVIVGAGAAGNAAAEMLRRRGYGGRVVMIGADPDLPYDRPNLSKDYLAGAAPEEWIPLRSADFYREQRIECVLGTRVGGLDAERREVKLLDGRTFPYDRLLLATGAEPVRLPVPTHGQSHVFTLRTLADSRAIIAAAKQAKRVVVVGSSFIGMEAAAALRARGLAVDVVSTDAVPFARTFGPELGRLFQQRHEAHGVRFHLGQSVAALDADSVTLKSGATLPADLVVVGIGVRPSIAIAQWAKLDVDNGVLVNEYLETSRAGIYAAGDIARWPDPHTGERIRVEHWVVAERQGQTAARNMLGERIPYRDVPFFWTHQYDVGLRYVGHHEKWDRIDVAGDLERLDASVTYVRGGKTLAVATLGRDHASLEAEVELERAG
ncbi:MAG TPA: FAD-dependent oxidoreductase [Gemmatimonadales bacterium]|nr:FAD-dependent oxidoreductase [Gemmatimonadales bacterium]